jgi:DNA processing protein
MVAEPLGDDELAGWLRLTETPGVGPSTARKLLGALGLPEQIFAAGRDAVARAASSTVADALGRVPAGFDEPLARTRAWLAEPGNHLITLADARYPKALLETTDPPTLLYVKGRLELLDASILAIVGSRQATMQGAIDTRRFAEAFAAQGLTIASGLALGIDAAAHEGALAAGAAGGSTIGVIATGADVVYPASHRALAHQIALAGVLVSELPLGTSASTHQFLRRNRIIAGLARGVLVVEAAARSGALATARMASDAGRDVFAVPGSIHSPVSKGCHQLIRQGAKLVESVDDVLDEWRAWRSAKAAGADGDNSDDGVPDALGRALGFDPVSTDELVVRTGLDAQAVSVALLDLELAGRVSRLPGGRFQRLRRGAVDPAPRSGGAP